MPALVPFILISSLACLAMIGVPQLTFLFGVLWGVCLVLGGYFLDRNRSLLLFAINLALLLILGSSAALYPLCFFGIPSLVMGLLLNQRKGYYTLQRWGMLAGVASLTIFLAFAYYGAGSEGMKTIQKEFNQYVDESLAWTQDSAIMQFYEEQGISPKEFEEHIRNTAQHMIYYLPALYYLECIIGVFLILYLSSYWCRRRGIPALEKQPFREETMPWPIAWVVIAGLSCWLLGRSEMSALYYIGGNILLISLPITAYFGLSGTVFRIAHMKPRGRKWAIAILVILLLIFSLTIIFCLSLLGLFDSLIDYRKLRSQKEE